MTVEDERNLLQDSSAIVKDLETTFDELRDFVLSFRLSSSSVPPQPGEIGPLDAVPIITHL